jgi:hypothetical protein
MTSRAYRWRRERETWARGRECTGWGGPDEEDRRLTVHQIPTGGPPMVSAGRQDRAAGGSKVGMTGG